MAAGLPQATAPRLRILRQGWRLEIAGRPKFVQPEEKRESHALGGMEYAG